MFFRSFQQRLFFVLAIVIWSFWVSPTLASQEDGSLTLSERDSTKIGTSLDRAHNQNDQTPEPEIGLDPNDPVKCERLMDMVEPFARCKLGRLDLKVPVGFRVSRIHVEARFAARLQEKGDLAGAVLRTRLHSRETISATKYIRADQGFEDGAVTEEQEFTVVLEFPSFQNCDQDLQKSFELSSTYMINSKTGGTEPSLTFKNIKILTFQFEPVTCS